jgi:hypothetical protein
MGTIQKKYSGKQGNCDFNKLNGRKLEIIGKR